MRKPQTSESGSIIVSILVIMIFLTITILSLGVMSEQNRQRSAQRIYLLQAQYAAESGADIALSYTNSGGTIPTGERPLLSYAPYYRATYEVSTISVDANKKTATSIGRMYRPATATTPDLTYKIKVDIERSTASFTSTIVSRNSVDIASSVKEVKGNSMFINEYLRSNKNGNKIIIDDLKIAGKYPDASNCSIVGTGDLIRSPELIAAGVKAQIRTSYNNCISPPGNSSNSDFNVTANDSSLQKVASINIPWDFKMNNNDGLGNYTSAGCSAWTNSPYNIPVSVSPEANKRKTHYPDTNAGVVAAFACTGSGSATGSGPADLNLGTDRTYTIYNHAHVRANLCKAYVCTPRFKNPDAGTTKFIFVEGVVNFENVIADDDPASPNYSPGSVVFISYSTNQAISASAQCPSSQASIRIGKATGSREILAPRAYFIAINGTLCIDQSKFTANRSTLGGVSGKDIYISSNSGGSFYLTFNPNFPLSQIPLDLTWRSANLKRLY